MTGNQPCFINAVTNIVDVKTTSYQVKTTSCELEVDEINPLKPLLFLKNSKILDKFKITNFFFS